MNTRLEHRLLAVRCLFQEPPQNHLWVCLSAMFDVRKIVRNKPK